MIGVYKIISPSGKIYIGQSTNLQKREIAYRSNSCKGQTKLYNSLVKYGFSAHIFEVIEQCTIEELNIRERHWQDFYNVVGTSGLNCLLVATDTSPYKCSEETRQRISQAAKGKKKSKEHMENKSRTCRGMKQTPEHIEKRCQAYRGRELSDSHKRKLSEAKKGKKQSKEHIQAIIESRKRNKELRKSQ